MSVRTIYNKNEISVLFDGQVLLAKRNNQEIPNLKIGILGNHHPTDLFERIDQVGAKNIHALYDEKRSSIRIFTASKLAVPQITSGRKAWKSQNVAEALKSFIEAKELSKKEPEHIDEAVSKAEHCLLKERSASESHLFLSTEHGKKLEQALLNYSTLDGILEYLDSLEYHRSYHHFLKALAYEIKKEKLLAANEYLQLAQAAAQPAEPLERGAYLLRKDPILLAQYLERVDREQLNECPEQMLNHKDAIRIHFERGLKFLNQNTSLENSPTCFLCYNTDEKDVEGWLEKTLVPDLVLAGITPIVSYRELRPGKETQQLEGAVAQADYAILVCTPGLKKEYEKNREKPTGAAGQIRMAIARFGDNTKHEKHFPLYLKGESVPPDLHFKPNSSVEMNDPPFFRYYEKAFGLFGALLDIHPDKSREIEENFIKQVKQVLKGHFDEKELNLWRSDIEKRRSALLTSRSRGLVALTQGIVPRNSIKPIRKALLDRYQQDHEIFEIPLPMSEETFPIEDFFTQLVLIKTEVQEKREKPAQNPEGGDRDALLKDHDQMTQFETDLERVEHDSLKEAQRTVEVEQPLEIHELLTKKGDEKDPKKVLIVGRAGVGKTTLINKIISDWVGERAFQEFEMVYRIPLRALNNKKNLSKAKDTSEWLAKAIAFHVLDNAEAVEEIHEHYLSNPSKILLLLDGMDEANAEVLERVGKLLQERDLSIILTSRPGEAVSGNRNNFDRRLENLGFSNQQLEQFVTRFFKNEKTQTEFLAALKKDSNLYSLSHTPLQLQMLCVQWKPGQEGFPSTLTGLYTQMIDDLWAWNWEHLGYPQGELNYEKKEHLFNVLGKVAEEGLKNNRLIIPRSEIEKILKEEKITRKELTETGLLKRTGNDYYFLHLTYQEYFIAYRVSHQSLAEQQKFIREHGFQPRYILVMSFLAGIVNAQDSSPTKENTKHLIESLRVELEDLSGAFQMELMLRSFSECDPEPWMNSYVLFRKYREALERYLIRGEGNSKLNKYIKYIKKPIFIAHIYPILRKNLYTLKSTEVLERTLKTLSACKNQTLDSETILALIELPSSSDWYVQEAARISIGEIGKNQKLDPETISALRELLSSSNSDVQKAAISALREISKNQTLDSETISALIKLLSSSNSVVRDAASIAIGEIGKNQKLDPETISALIKLASSSDWYVQTAASKALREISKNQMQDPKTTAALREQFSSSRRGVQRAAIYEHAEISKYQVLDPKTISALREQLSSINSVARDAASIALQAVSNNQKLDPETISALREQLSSINSVVRDAASIALQAISKNQKLDPETISVLIELLTSSNWDEQEGASIALKEISKNQKLDPETSSALIKLASSSDSVVQQAAIYPLGKISKNQKLDPETSSALIKLVSSSDSDVQQAAIYALRKISKNQKLDPETTSALIELLTSTNRDVRYAGSTALKEISKNQTLNPETISALIKLVFSSDSDVQQAAIYAHVEISNNQVIDPETIPAFIELLTSTNRDVRYAASTALNEISKNQLLPDKLLSRIVKKHLVVLKGFSLCNILNAVCISKSCKAFVVLLHKCFEQGSPLYFKENLLCTIENNKEISGGVPLKEQKKFIRWAKKYSPFGDCFLE